MSVLFLGGLRKLFSSGPSVESVDAKRARVLQLEEGALILDVRGLNEWRAGHAPGAKHIPLGELDRKMGSLPRDKTLIVVCASGMRSRVGARRLVAAGFSRVLNLSAGMNGWQDHGLPMKK